MKGTFGMILLERDPPFAPSMQRGPRLGHFFATTRQRHVTRTSSPAWTVAGVSTQPSDSIAPSSVAPAPCSLSSGAATLGSFSAATIARTDPGALAHGGTELSP